VQTPMGRMQNPTSLQSQANLQMRSLSSNKVCAVKKRCHRKIYKLVNPIAHAISGAAITDETSLNKLRLGELAALDAMKRGLGTVEDWRLLTDMMNIAEMMGKSGIGPEVLEWCKQAQESLYKAAQRYEKTGVMGLDGQGIKALTEVYEYHDAQRTSVARSVYEQMIEKTRNYIKSHGKDVVSV